MQPPSSRVPAPVVIAAVATIAIVAIAVLAWVVPPRLREGAATSSDQPSQTGARGPARPSTSSAASLAPVPSGVPVLVGAGDIAVCGSDADEATAALLATTPGSVFTAGDNAYDRGRPDEFERCYGPSWGRERARTTFPAPGNHDYGTRNAAGYLGYFGQAAAPDGTTWYSRDVGAWHVIVLDSDCGAVGGCGPDSAQGRWLHADLAASSARCTLAIWHHPRFSSGSHGNDGDVAPFWTALYAAGADVVVNGHDHDYERFAPQTPDGQPDGARGLREFVVGTGGAGLRDFDDVRPNSEARDATSHGVLRLTLRPDGYDWAFVPIAGDAFADAGSGSCY